MDYIPLPSVKMLTPNPILSEYVGMGFPMARQIQSDLAETNFVCLSFLEAKKPEKCQNEKLPWFSNV